MTKIENGKENKKMNYLIKNKMEENDFSELEINILSDIRKSGLSGKYIIDVEIKRKNKKIEKEYICSVTKKDEEGIHLFLTHLDPIEINKMFQKL